MADSAEPRTRRYSAFISYSRTDSAFVQRLHRQLEGYRLPRQVRVTGDAPTRRLKPFFRDTTDLSAASDLTEAVREALAESDFLIVVCSPNAAQSKWVGREIELFRRLREDHQILTVLASGDTKSAFPEALRRHADGHAIDPLAADFRPTVGDGRKALLKLVAPLAGVHLDDLVHRDRQRQRVRAALATAAGLAAAAVVTTLTVTTVNARNDAAVQAKRANGLGDFMVSDLRKGLEAAGRHDLLKQVNEAALKSYQAADFSKLTPEQALQFAKGLQGAAKDQEKAGDLKAARENADRAYRITAALLAPRPNDWDRVFAHAQSEYWVGFFDWRAGDSAGARARFEAYASLADRLVAVAPANDAGRMERVYAANNLGMLALRQGGNAAGAEPYFRRVLTELDTIIAHKPGDTDAQLSRANDLAFLADCARLQGRLAEATRAREAQKAILLTVLANNPRNLEVRSPLLGYRLGVARIALADGDVSRAQSLLQAGHELALDFARQDPDNKDFPKQARMFELFQAKAWLDRGGRNPSIRQIAQTLGDCAPMGPGAVNQEIGDFCGVLLARLRSRQGDQAGAALALAPVKAHLAKQHDVLTGRWGLNLVAETQPVQLAIGGAK